MSNIPNLGCKDHILIDDPELKNKVQENGDGDYAEINDKFSTSLFTLDGTINPHPRFPYLVKSIREKRGCKVDIQIPLFKDTNTDLTSVTKEEPYPGKIYMDAMAFGMGASCLQITYETQHVNHATYLHDQLLAFTSYFAALSASAPIFKGKLSDNDMRWTVISQSVDCRTPEE